MRFDAWVRGLLTEFNPRFFCFFEDVISKKVFCYVDGFNLYHRLDEGSPGNKWLNIESLLFMLLNRLPSTYKVEKIKYFTSAVRSPEDDPNKFIRQKKHWAALETLQKVQLIKGRFVKQKGKKQHEKQTDVNLACHVIDDIWSNLLDIWGETISSIVLVSNDSDFKMPLQLARDKYRKEVIVISPDPCKPIADELRKVSDYCLNIPPSLLKRMPVP